nr:metallophosphoesterase [Cytophagales bacterium]
MKNNQSDISQRANYFILVFFLAAFTVSSALAQQDPTGIFLTWKEDPLTTMVVDWHLEASTAEVLHVSEKGSGTWAPHTSHVHPFPHSERYIHRVALSGLKPGTSYSIKFGKRDKVYYFNTMPADISKEAIRIAIGGDSMHDQAFMEKTNSQVAKYDPHFAVIGGDLAYANGDPKNVKRWYQWFDAVKNTLIREDGRIIPLVLGIGNHEVRKGVFEEGEEIVYNDENRAKMAPFYYGLFAFPGQPGYGVLDFGKYFSFFLLDSDHSNPIIGPQTDWFKRELAVRDDVTQIITMHHVPAYPSVRDFNGTTQARVREHWLPLIEKAGVKLVFENHDHAYKRTFPIKNNQVDKDGVVYIGDGSWGTTPREVHDPATTWYLDKAISVRAFTLVTLQGSAYNILSIDEDGNVIDSYPPNPLIK